MTEEKREAQPMIIDIPKEPVPVFNPGAMIMSAVQGQEKVNLDLLEQLMDLNQKYEEREAKKAFYEAMANFHNEDITITRDGECDYTTTKGRTHYKFATLGNIVKQVGPFLGKHGLRHTWSFTTASESVNVIVTCTITHSLGHSESVSLSGAPDPSGGKNPIQALGSTTTYLKKYTFLAATGLSMSEDDDDGNGGQQPSREKMYDLAEWKKYIEELVETCLSAENPMEKYFFSLGKKDDQMLFDLSEKEYKVAMGFAGQQRPLLMAKKEEKPEMIKCPMGDVMVAKSDCETADCRDTCQNFK